MDDFWKVLMAGAIAVISALLAWVWQSSRINCADCKGRIALLEKDRLHISDMVARIDERTARMEQDIAEQRQDIRALRNGKKQSTN